MMLIFAKVAHSDFKFVGEQLELYDTYVDEVWCDLHQDMRLIPKHACDVEFRESKSRFLSVCVEDFTAQSTQ